ncbi:MAG: phosphoribosylformylglycinamidine cyclo-ligase [Halodesulfurarchaeum sp.]
MTDEGLTYAEAGVDIEDSDAAVGALVSAMDDLEDTTAYAGMVDIGDRYLALATDGVGTKLLVAEALEEYTTIGIDCIAMNVNDLVAAGITPVGFVDYLAVDEPSEQMSAAIGEGLATGAERAGLTLLGGETAVLPEVIEGFDLAGAAAGLATKEQLLDGEAQPGDVLVGIPSSGIHSNGLTLARRALTADHEYTDQLPGGEGTIGQALLEPTRIYTYLLDTLHQQDVHAAAHMTGGGWTNLFRLGEYRYEITDPLPAHPVFEFVQSAGGVSDEEMARTFNMGTGFVMAVDPADAEAVIEETDGEEIGRVKAGDTVSIRGVELTAD